MEYIKIAKKPGKKDCIRINTMNDIPDNLKNVINIENDQLVLDCLEGVEKVPLGSVIAYEKLENGKMNVWNKANYKETTVEVNGEFFELPKSNVAMPLEDELPDEIKSGLGDKLSITDDNEYQIETDWGKVSCKPGNGYLVIYGKKEDGSLDANFLTKGTPSFEKYFVVDENGELVQTLTEYDKKLTESKDIGMGSRR